MKNKWTQISGQWKRFSVEAKKKWDELTDAELTHVNGSRNTLASVIQRRYFLTKKEAHDQIDSWTEELKI